MNIACTSLHNLECNEISLHVFLKMHFIFLSKQQLSTKHIYTQWSSRIIFFKMSLQSRKKISLHKQLQLIYNEFTRFIITIF